MASEINFKSLLQEYCQGKGFQLPVYFSKNTQAPWQSSVTVTINNIQRKFKSKNNLKKKKAAEQQAAHIALSSCAPDFLAKFSIQPYSSTPSSSEFQSTPPLNQLPIEHLTFNPSKLPVSMKTVGNDLESIELAAKKLGYGFCDSTTVQTSLYPNLYRTNITFTDCDSVIRGEIEPTKKRAFDSALKAASLFLSKPLNQLSTSFSTEMSPNNSNLYSKSIRKTKSTSERNIYVFILIPDKTHSWYDLFCTEIFSIIKRNRSRNKYFHLYSSDNPFLRANSLHFHPSPYYDAEFELFRSTGEILVEADIKDEINFYSTSDRVKGLAEFCKETYQHTFFSSHLTGAIIAKIVDSL